MRKLFASLLVLFVIAFFQCSAKAQSFEKEQGYISVNESSTREVAANQAEFSINIETSAESLQKASDENKAIASNVYSSVKMLLGVDDYMKTSGYSARPEYTYTKDNKRILDKYIVSNKILVKTKQIESVPKFIDTAISKGASVENLQFSAVDYDCVCNDLLQELSQKAYLRACGLAKAVDSQVAGVKSINATCNREGGQRPYFAMMAKNSAESASSTPIESGKIKINANVDASFYVK